VGTNYLQLPINAPQTHVATNLRGGQMLYQVDGVESGENPHIDYEPSSRQGLVEAQPSGTPYTPYVEGPVERKKISRTNDFKQAGERYRSFEDWEREDLIANLISNLKQCNRDIQERMVGFFAQADGEYGRRVAEGLGIPVPEGAKQPARAQ
jgi:catalase